MKKNILISIFIVAILFCGCEEVIDIDLATADPKLVIEADINWQKGTSGAQQTIKLTTTTGYFDTDIPIVTGATIYIKNSANQQFNFTEVPNTGTYICKNFKPVIDQEYTLTVVSNENTYTATETMKSVAPITRIEQDNLGGLAGDNIIIRAYYKDPVDVENYYLYKYVYTNKVVSSYYVDKDELFEGNEFFSISEDDDLSTGDEIEITHIGISKQYYNYMNVLIGIAGSSFQGPFQTPPATVKGNIVNVTDKENYPLGYFSLSEIDVKKYSIK